MSRVDCIRWALEVVRGVVASRSPDLVYVVGSRRFAGFVESVVRSAMVLCEVVFVRVVSDDEVLFLCREAGDVFFLLSFPAQSKMFSWFLSLCRSPCPRFSVYVVRDDGFTGYRLTGLDP